MALPLLAVLLFAGAPASASAQNTPRAQQLEAELRELMQKIEPVRERATLERAQRDSVLARNQRAAVPLDTLSVGPLTVVAPVEHADAARTAFMVVWDDFAPQVGSAVDWSDVTFVYDVGRRLMNLRFSTHSTYRVDGWGWELGDFKARFSEGLVPQRIREAFGTEVYRQAPDGLKMWLTNGTFTPTPQSALGDAYRSMVLNASNAAAACVDGDLEGCWSALGFVDQVDPVDEWAQRRVDPGEVGFCDEAEGCEAFAWSGTWRGWPQAIPLHRNFRADFLSFALAQGGEGALERLYRDWPEDISYTRVRSDGTEREIFRDPTQHILTFGSEVRPRIVAASGMSEDELMAAWRDRIMNARPDLRANEDRDRSATFLWVLFFAAFAMRSTRWRLG